MAAAAAMRSGSPTRLVVLDEGETSGEDAVAFFQLLGCSDPAGAKINPAS